jgi:hypothetical protein
MKKISSMQLMFEPKVNLTPEIACLSPQVSWPLLSAEINLPGDRCGGTDNKSGNLAKKRTVSVLLLSSSLCFGGGADLAGDSNEFFVNRQLFEHHSSLK